MPRPNGPVVELTVRGGKTLRLVDEHGAERDVTMKDGGFGVENGRVVAATAATTR